MDPLTNDSSLDAIDIQILCAVQAHGLISKTKLAEMVNLSATPCWKRLDRLKALGFVRGQHANIAIEKLCNLTQTVVTVSLAQHRKSDFQRFEDHIKGTDEITECIATGGGFDYVMQVYCASLSDFQKLMEDMLDAGLGIERYMTYFATRTVKNALPNLESLAKISI